MRIHHHIKSGIVGLATAHPILATIVTLTGIGAVMSIATGATNTPSPAVQNQTTLPKAGA